MLVWILQTGIDEDRRRAAVEPLFEVFLGDSGNRHAANCRRVIGGLSTGAPVGTRGYVAMLRLNGTIRALRRGTT